MKRWLLLLAAVCAPALGADLQVPADFPTVQEAVDAAEPGDRVLIAPGIYLEQVVVTTPRLQLIGTGAGPADTVLQTDRNYFGLDPLGEMWKRRSLALTAWRDIEVHNLTIENTFDQLAAQLAGLPGRSKAARFIGRVVATDTIFIGWTDTLQVYGSGFFERVEVQGKNDYVYGQGSAVFRDSLFYSRSSGAVIGQGSVLQTQFVFEDCRFEAAAGIAWWLAQPWKPYSTVFISDSYLGPGLRRGVFKERAGFMDTVLFHECGNFGPGTDVERVSWARSCD